MNIKKLKEAEAKFYFRYPGGWSDPEMVAIARKHHPERMQAMAAEFFAPEAFDDIKATAQNMIKIVSASSMVSMFEKPKFRDLVKSLQENKQEELVLGLREFLHGEQEQGFCRMRDLLMEYKLAKWVLMTIIPVYYRPSYEVFIKPNTVKMIIKEFELEGLVYKPFPTFDFYSRYRDTLNLMKQHVDPDLGRNNAAFSGLLMITNQE